MDRLTKQELGSQPIQKKAHYKLKINGQIKKSQSSKLLKTKE